MKRFLIISTLAVLAAMIFGSLLHRRGQDSSAIMQEARGNTREVRTPSSVAESQMPFDSPLMPELLPEPKSELTKVKLASVPEAREQRSFSNVESLANKRDAASPLKKLVTTVDLSKLAAQDNVSSAVTDEVAVLSSEPALEDGRFLPIVLHIGSEEGKLVLQGSIPTRENTDAVYASAVKLFGEDSVENHLKYSPETIHAGWVDDLPAYVEKFFSHSAGDQELIVVDGILKLRGDVPSENSRNGLIALADSFKERGLEIDHQLEVKESLAGDLPELPGTYAASGEVSTEAEEAEPKEAIELVMLDPAVQLSIGEEAKSRSASIAADELDLKSEPKARDGSDSEPVVEAPAIAKFHGPAESPKEWAAAVKKKQDELAAAQAAKLVAKKAATKAKAEQEAAALAATEKEKAEMVAVAKAEAEQKAADLAAAEKKKAERAAQAIAAKEANLAAMIESGERIPDDGKPLIFYFETGSSEIVSSDREKIVRAIQRVKIPRSIVYITAYADHRGDYELNRKLSLERAEKIRELIFAGDTAAEVTAEISAKGESQSAKAKTDEALKRSRRVVVEVYHLKR